MGRKKKPFIDKKNAITFNLVHRSQKDPLIDENEHGQMVLAANTDVAHLSHEDQQKEQQKYGIFFKDEYDYLQHLKEPSSTQPVVLDVKDKLTSSLPAELFGSEVKTIGIDLDKVVPLSGPQLTWDPDVVAALDDEEINEESDEEHLEDDFVLLANGGEPGLPVYIREDCDHTHEQLEPWWVDRGDYKLHPLSHDLYQSDYDKERRGECESASPDPSDMTSDNKSFKFTEYSLSSSVVPRSEGLTLLDEKFEEFMLEYEDNQIGPLEETERDEVRRETENILLKSAIDEFSHKHESTTTSLSLVEKMREVHIVENYDDGQVKEQDTVQLEGDQQWDCESILSTYSNLYNHPTLIKEPPQQKIHLSRKTGLPLPDKLDDNMESISLCSTVSQASTHRPRNETPEERRLRKQAIKEERRVKRCDKKATRLAFKKEQLIMERQLISNPRTTPMI